MTAGVRLYRRRVSHFPAGVALELQRELRRYIEELTLLVQRQYEQVLLPALLRAGVRADAPVDEVRAALENLYRSMLGVMSEDRAREIMRRAVTAAQLRAVEQFKRELRAARLGDVGIEYFLPPGRLHDIAEARIAEGVRLIKTIPDHLSEELERRIFEALARGAGANDLAREIAELADQTRARAKTIAVDQINRAYNAFAQERMSLVGVKHVIWLTAEDERTCPKCSPRHGRRFLLEELQANGEPPLHPVCRCTLIADAEELRAIVQESL
jgi:SPP1 gp7 family putative phage head morphogenesis protein